MNHPLNDAEVDAAIKQSLGTPPQPDFGAWQQKHGDQLAKLESAQDRRLAYVRTRRKLLFLIAVAALVVFAVMLFNRLEEHTVSNVALAGVLTQLGKADNITWKLTFYMRATSKDGKTSWLVREPRQMAYKAPGLYREGPLDPSQPVTIQDSVNGQELHINPQKKEAILEQIAAQRRSPEGPFAWVGKELKASDLQWVGRRSYSGGEVNVFRRSFYDAANKKPWSYDFWVDTKSKKITEVHVPGADIFDPDKDPDRNTPAGTWHLQTPVGFVQSDIAYDAALDPSLFSMDPPQGYETKKNSRSYVSEKEMVEFLGLLAESNDGTFPDQALGMPAIKIINKAEAAADGDRSPAARKLAEKVRHYMMTGLNEMPVSHFIQDSAVDKSFRYIGKGVKLGEKDRIVCWYQLKGKTDYRVMYGDLSLKDASEEDLPLPGDP